jgi:cellulose synthase/poly-beta-1,6-N-acetylglucosamine synthase-like glycosyltransferase
MIIILTSAFFVFLYFIQISKYLSVWVKTPQFKSGNIEPDVFISLIVPFKNEAGNLNFIITDIQNQNYNPDRFELILVNDHSTDNFLEIVTKLILKHPSISLLNLPEGMKGKKTAIDYGISKAKFDLIMTSDADCRPGPDWILEMAEFYATGNYKMICGIVKMIPEKSFFSRFQSLEFLSLSGIGAASILAKKPVMCSAANLFFEKKLYFEAKEKLHMDFPSGDDMFLLLYLNRHYPGNAGCLKSPLSIVSTNTKTDLKSFVKQRTRWSSKALLYTDANLIYLSCLVFLLNLSILMLGVSSFFQVQYLAVFTGVLIIKSIPDYFFLKSVSGFLKQRHLMSIFIPSQLVYPFYIVFIAINGFVNFIFRKK